MDMVIGHYNKDIMFNKRRLSKAYYNVLALVVLSISLSAADKDDSGSKPTETNAYVFDVSRVNATRTLETPALFAKIWSAFRTQHALGDDGEFVREAAATTPDSAETLAAFHRYVAANSPVVRLESEQKCKACTKGKKPAIVDFKVVQVECTKCKGSGLLWVVDSYQLIYTGVVPAKPAPKVAAPNGAKPAAEAKPAAAPGSRADEYRMLVERIMVLGKRFDGRRGSPFLLQISGP